MNQYEKLIKEKKLNNTKKRKSHVALGYLLTICSNL